MPNPWPEFIRHDPIGDMYYHPEVLNTFADYILVGQDAQGQIVAKAHAIPFRLDSPDLPDDGWDGAIQRGLRTRISGVEPNAIAALEIVVVPELQGRGLSGQVLAALRDHAARLGFAELLVPVRPNGKTDIAEPMSSYALRTRTDGLPADPWLRVHIRAGGHLEKVASRSMVIPGTLDEWRKWTGLPFDTSGPIDVPQGLAPVWCDVEHGTAVYTEPNVWVRHHTGL